MKFAVDQLGDSKWLVYGQQIPQRLALLAQEHLFSAAGGDEAFALALGVAHHLEHLAEKEALKFADRLALLELLRVFLIIGSLRIQLQPCGGGAGQISTQVFAFYDLHQNNTNSARNAPASLRA